MVASIAAAIEEQATTTKDIAGGVDRAAGEMAGGSDRTRAGAGQLSTMAESLREGVGRFRAWDLVYGTKNRVCHAAFLLRHPANHAAASTNA